MAPSPTGEGPYRRGPPTGEGRLPARAAYRQPLPARAAYRRGPPTGEGRLPARAAYRREGRLPARAAYRRGPPTGEGRLPARGSLSATVPVGPD